MSHFYKGAPSRCIFPGYIQLPILLDRRGLVVHCLWQNGVVAVDVLFQWNVILKLQVILESEKQQQSLLLLNLPVNQIQDNRHSAEMTAIYSVFCYLWFIHGFNILQVHSQLLSLLGFFAVHLENCVMSLFQFLRRAKSVQRIVSLRLSYVFVHQNTTTCASFHLLSTSSHLPLEWQKACPTLVASTISKRTFTALIGVSVGGRVQTKWSIQCTLF